MLRRGLMARALPVLLLLGAPCGGEVEREGGYGGEAERGETERVVPGIGEAEGGEREGGIGAEREVEGADD